jgi:hypothetical protein
VEGGADAPIEFLKPCLVVARGGILVHADLQESLSCKINSLPKASAVADGNVLIGREGAPEGSGEA